MRHLRALRERAAEWRLPPAERRAARLERQAEERLRRERDWFDPRQRRLDRDAAERAKWSGFGP